jgi:predicted short-subunit dehydrogenase-like oxidoreductase (DUF2520 family)
MSRTWDHPPWDDVPVSQHATPPSIGIVGFGRVGAAFAAGFAACGHPIAGVTARRASTRDRVDAIVPSAPVLEPVEVIARADVTFLTVPDDAVPALAGTLAGAVRPGTVVAHACGVSGLEILDPLSAAGALAVAIHPVMTFSGSSLDVQRMRGAPFAVSAPDLYRPVATLLVEELGGVPFWVAGADRPAYHAALCQAANHCQVLIDSARGILQALGVDDPEGLLRPVVTAAVDGALRDGIGALTGPASRGDVGTLAVHVRGLDALSAGARERDGDPAAGAGELYRTMARATLAAAWRAGRIDDEHYAAGLDALRLGAGPGAGAAS